jgi:hypothetical protein
MRRDVMNGDAVDRASTARWRRWNARKDAPGARSH